MAYTEIQTAVEDRIMTITMHRPDRMNAFTGTMMQEMIQAFDEADADDNVRVVIVTGSGNRAFCAGADLGAGGKTFDYEARGAVGAEEVNRDGGGLLTLRIFESKKPVIAAINGAAVGIGATMTCAMDIRLASTSARMGFVFSRRGIVPEAASSWFLPRIVGIQQALEWVYSGRVFDAQEALNGRLVRSLHAPEDLLPAARALAKEIAENTSAVSVALARHMMWRMLGADHPMEAHKVDSRGVQATGKGADAKEGVTSFLEKRPPNFTLSAARDMPAFFPWWEERKFS
ncbi:crotonase/enoyl-CoA hydratase family protein [Zavarzinia sp. CC-PAN008]|uniref:crotonase/enoyl-CoA hydratase family protein n=1 Tax=Zavarzinia sp. CC-PAN008 TaxID=3243332 RepID=UPI003F742BB0